MNILDIYTHYQIPPNLQRHQQEVAAVCQTVLEQWNGAEIDRDLTISTALLHDLGNIIKFQRPFLGELEADAEHWQAIQDEFIARYGNDVKIATAAIVEELGLLKVGSVLEQMEQLIHQGSTDSWEARVVEFGDMQVAPSGIISFNDRLKDLIARYNYTGQEPWVSAVKENYRLVKKQTNCDVENIYDKDYSLNIEHLKTWNIDVFFVK